MARSEVLRYPVMPEECDSCIFGPNSPVSAERLAEIQRYLLNGTTHLCHKPLLHAKRSKAACRGGRAWQLQVWHRMGLLPEPTDAALEARMEELGVQWP